MTHVSIRSLQHVTPPRFQPCPTPLYRYVRLGPAQECFESSTIIPLESQADYCVGERLSFSLSGHAPFDVFYTSCIHLGMVDHSKRVYIEQRCLQKQVFLQLSGVFPVNVRSWLICRVSVSRRRVLLGGQAMEKTKLTKTSISIAR